MIKLTLLTFCLKFLIFSLSKECFSFRETSSPFTLELKSSFSISIDLKSAIESSSLLTSSIFIPLAEYFSSLVASLSQT